MSLIIKNAKIVNENKIYNSDVLIVDKKIKKISSNINISAERILDAKGLHLFPGIIDDQVHFRDPGLTHKANIYTESKARYCRGYYFIYGNA